MTAPLSRSQPTTIALGLSLLVIAVIGLFQFAGTHQIGWLVMILPFVFVSPDHCRAASSSGHRSAENDAT